MLESNVLLDQPNAVEKDQIAVRETHIGAVVELNELRSLIGELTVPTSRERLKSDAACVLQQLRKCEEAIKKHIHRVHVLSRG